MRTKSSPYQGVLLGAPRRTLAHPARLEWRLLTTEVTLLALLTVTYALFVSATIFVEAERTALKARSATGETALASLETGYMSEVRSLSMDDVRARGYVTEYTKYFITTATAFHDSPEQQ